MSRAEPMNAASHHSQASVALALSDPVFLAGTHISGKMQVECRTDGLGIGVIMVELCAIQEVHSGDDSATSTFIHARRVFQGPGLPPSNAVHPGPSDLALPAHHHPARRGQTTFFFQFPIPASSPSSMSFGPASIKYEVRASAGVAWDGDKSLVTDTRQVTVVEAWDPLAAALSPQAVAITEGGRIWAQATLTNDIVVAGQSACIDLLLRNHTLRWTSGVTVTLTRHLDLSPSFLAGRSPPDISDVATQVEFRGPEYSVPPGVEGIARLVIDIPRHSRGVKGGLRLDSNAKATESFFEVRSTLKLTIDMPPGSEDTVIHLPLTIYHSLAIPQTLSSPFSHLAQDPYSWQYAPSIQRSTSLGTRGDSSHAPSPRLLPPPPTHVPYSSTTQNLNLSSYHPSLLYHYSVPQSHVDHLSSPRPPPIEIPSLPNPHDSQGVLHSPRPVPSPKHSFHGSLPKSDNVSELERMAEDGGGAGVEAQGPQHTKLLQTPQLNVVDKTKTLPALPVPSTKDNDRQQRLPRVDTLFTSEESMASTSDHSPFHLPPHAPPTPPIAAITPIKFPKALTELAGLGANLGTTQDMRSESGLDALERRLLAEVGTRKFHDDDADMSERRQHARNVVVQPITIPPSAPPPDTVNDSAISSLTLADREGILGADTPERENEQEQDRDSDEHTQHLSGRSGRLSPSEDDRDVRTQKGKESRKAIRSNHGHSDGEAVVHRERPSRRKKAKDRHEGRKMRQEARGRVAAWLGEIDASTPPSVAMDDPLSSPTASHFIEGASLGPLSLATADAIGVIDMEIINDDKKTQGRPRDVSTDKPNPRSSGFVTISSLGQSGSGGDLSSSKQSMRRVSMNAIVASKEGRSPVLYVPSPAELTGLSPSPSPLSQEPTSDSVPPGRLDLLRWPSKPPVPADREAKYDIRSARGGRGGRVTQVASLWAAKVNAVNAGVNSNKVNVDPKPKPKPRKERDSLPPKPPKPASLSSTPTLRLPTKKPASSTLPTSGAAAGAGVVKPIALSNTPTPTPPRVPAKKPVLSTLPTTAAAAGAGVGLRRPPPSMNAFKRSPVSVGLSVGGRESLGYVNTGVHDTSKAATKTSKTTTGKATTVPAVVSSSHAVPMLSSTASLARTKVHSSTPGLALVGQGQGHGMQGHAQMHGHALSLPPMISGTISDVRNGGGGGGKTGPAQQGRALGDLAFGQARLRDLIKKYQG